MLCVIPTREEIERLRVGSYVLDEFGKISQVVGISYTGKDEQGRYYVGFYTRLGEYGTLSGSYKEGRLVRTLPLSNAYTSAELDKLERQWRLESRRGIWEITCARSAG